jgi:hypothetical protein
MTERQRTGRSYDRVAGDYAAQILDELKHKPFDRAGCLTRSPSLLAVEASPMSGAARATSGLISRTVASAPSVWTCLLACARSH